MEKLSSRSFDNWVFQDACNKAKTLLMEKQVLASMIIAYSKDKCYTLPIYDLVPGSKNLENNVTLVAKLFAAWGVEHYILITECWLSVVYLPDGTKEDIVDVECKEPPEYFEKRDGLMLTSINQDRKVIVLYEIIKEPHLSLKEYQRLDSSQEDVEVSGFLLKLLPPNGYRLHVPQKEIDDLLSNLKYQVEEFSYERFIEPYGTLV